MSKISKYTFEQSYSIVQILSKSQSSTTSIIHAPPSSYKYFICKHYIIVNLIPSEIQTITNEISTLSNLNHPNIIKLIQHFKNQKQISIIEEYCEEGDLAYHIKQQQKKQKLFKQQIIQQWILQILLALDYIHINKVVHRDLKPSNIFLTSMGNIKLGSFGLSKSLKNQKFASTCVGSPSFMSPEIINSKPYDMRTDIWALGCIIYELCMLKPPFDSTNLMQLLNKISKTEAQQIPISYSAFLSNVVKRCLRKNPEKRPTAFQLLRQPYFHSVMDKFVKNNGIVSKQIGIKKYNVHKGKNNENIKKKQSKSFRNIKQQQSKISKIPRKSSAHPKQRDNKPQNAIKSKEKIISSVEKIRQMIVGKSRQKIKMSQGLKQKEKSKQIQKEKQKLKKAIQKSRQKEKDKSKILSSQKNKNNVSLKQQPKLNIQGKQSISIIKPSIPISPSKQLASKIAKKESNKAKTTESVQNSNQQIKIYQTDNSWLGEEEIDYSLTKTGKFDGQFDFLKKPPVLDQNLSQRDSDASIDESCRLTLSVHNEVPSLIQTYKSKMEEVAKQINQKYEPRMQVIQQRTFQFGSDQFVKDPGSYQNKQFK